MIRDQRIIITGGAGFLGTHLAMRLAGENRVTLLDLNLRQNSLSYSQVLELAQVTPVEGDVRDARLIEPLVADADIVVHLASRIGVQYVVDHARETIDTIVSGTRAILEAASKNGSLLRLVNVSTSEVYGETDSTSDQAPASIGTSNDPRTSYAAAKLLAEHMAWAYHRDFGVPVVNVRPFNVYGPLQRTKNATNIFIARALSGRPLHVHGDGSQLRPWCYVDDFTRGLLSCLERPVIGQDFNLGNPLTTTTVFDLAERIVRLTGSSSPIELVPRPYSDFAVRVPGWQKASRLLGYDAEIDLDTGLARTIAWHREHASDLRDM
jgi:nucleoside-diphosphate-sugar epimerase